MPVNSSIIAELKPWKLAFPSDIQWLSQLRLNARVDFASLGMESSDCLALFSTDRSYTVQMEGEGQEEGLTSISCILEGVDLTDDLLSLKLRQTSIPASMNLSNHFDFADENDLDNEVDALV